MAVRDNYHPAKKGGADGVGHPPTPVIEHALAWREVGRQDSIHAAGVAVVAHHGERVYLRLEV